MSWNVMVYVVLWFVMFTHQVKLFVLKMSYNEIGKHHKGNWLSTLKVWFFARNNDTPSKAPIVTLSKKLHDHCVVLVGSRNGFERDLSAQPKPSTSNIYPNSLYFNVVHSLCLNGSAELCARCWWSDLLTSWLKEVLQVVQSYHRTVLFRWVLNINRWHLLCVVCYTATVDSQKTSLNVN